MDIHPICTAKDHRAALKEIEGLMNASKGSPEGDRLEILTTLVEDWENRHLEILPPDPLEAIRFRMEQMGLSASDIAPMVGGANRVSEILHGKRGLTLAMVRNLHKGLRIPTDVLVG